MGIDEFIVWAEYYKYDPFGNERQDMNAGAISAMIFNRGRSKDEKAMSADDCMLKFDKQKKTQTTDEQIQIAEIYTIGLGGKDLRKKK